MTPTSEQQNNHFFLYDAELLPEVQPQLFDPSHHRHQRTIQGEALGRGATYFVRVGDHACVLRHYQRGGLAAKFLSDQYLWGSIEKTRAWREWHLLNLLTEKNLPVPRPVAAHVVRRGLYYRADLMTLRLNTSKSLTDYLRKRELGVEQWRNIGRTVRAFHNAGVYHADLNAHNIMLTDNLTGNGEVHLIDFDKCHVRPVQPGWQKANVERLHRSLLKLSSLISPFYYSAIVWQQFLQGYNRG